MNDSNFLIVEPLTRICEERASSFNAAAKAVRSADLKLLFRQCAEQRAQFARDLQRGSVDFSANHSANRATAHDGWMPIRQVSCTRDEDAILADCERAERAALAAYLETLETSGIPDSVREVVTDQCIELMAVRDRIRDLCDSLVTTH